MALGQSQHDPGYTTSASYNRDPNIRNGSSATGGRESTASHEPQRSAFSGFSDFLGNLFGFNAPTLSDAPPVEAMIDDTTTGSTYKTKYPQWAGITKTAARIAGGIVGQDYFDQLIHVESRGKANAKSPLSSAGGLFQFTSGTAARYGLKNKYDPAQAAVAVGKLTRDNYKGLKSALGRNPTYGELYMAHQQGLGGAKKALTANPDANAVSVLGRKQVLNNGGNSRMTIAQFNRMWSNKFSGKSRNASGSGGTAVVNPSSTGYDRGFWSMLIGGNPTDIEISDTIDSIRSGTIGLEPGESVMNWYNADEYEETGTISIDTAGSTYGFSPGAIFDKLASGNIGGALGDFAGGLLGKGEGSLGGIIGNILGIGGPLGAVGNLLTGSGDVAAETQGGLSDIGTVIETYFLRIIIIVLGLIFVGVGLAMFGKPIVQEVRKAL